MGKRGASPNDVLNGSRRARPAGGLGALRSLGGGALRRPLTFASALQPAEQSPAAATALVPSVAPARPHARDTPREAANLLQPPPRGTTWSYPPTGPKLHANADGADAGPNAIQAVCVESLAAVQPWPRPGRLPWASLGLG